MSKFKKHYPALKIIFLSFLLIALSTSATLANVVDSDLSNTAGTNKNWKNAFWFFVNLSLLITVCVAGYNKKFTKINRHYIPREHI